MQHRKLGRSGLRVSSLCLGAMTFGQSKGFMKDVTSSDGEARRVLDAALDAGIDFVDTADIYSEGGSETLLGQWLEGRRQKIVLATKCRFPMGPGPNEQGLARQHVVAACEASLRRLRTDFIDLYQMHLQDTDVPIEETLRALDDLQRAGKSATRAARTTPARAWSSRCGRPTGGRPCATRACSSSGAWSRARPSARSCRPAGTSG